MNVHCINCGTGNSVEAKLIDVLEFVECKKCGKKLEKKDPINIRMITDYTGKTRLVPMQDVFLLWMLQKDTSKETLQKMIFDNYPIYDFKKSIKSYGIKLPIRMCIVCKNQITGEQIIPVEEGFICSTKCLGNRVLIACDELEQLVGKF